MKKRFLDRCCGISTVVFFVGFGISPRPVVALAELREVGAGAAGAAAEHPKLHGFADCHRVVLGPSQGTRQIWEGG